MLREAGAAEVHVRISSPPVKWPCFYGIDFATRAELVANGLGVEEIRASIGADSLGYISEDDMIGATGQDRSRLCLACFDGTYPVGVPEEAVLGKHLLERALPSLPLTDVTGENGRVPAAREPVREPARASLDVEGVPIGLAGGAADALSRP
jgi:amidophosphoribosyltransferase